MRPISRWTKLPTRSSCRKRVFAASFRASRVCSVLMPQEKQAHKTGARSLARPRQRIHARCESLEVHKGMLMLYRRHLDSCPHAFKGRKHKRCKCPVWVDGTYIGMDVRRSLKTRSWEDAERELEKLKESPA